MAPANIVVHTANSWGHMKPAIALFARIAEHRPASAVVFTIMTGMPTLPKVVQELQLLPEHIVERIHVVDVGPPKTLIEPALGFISAFQDLWNGKPVTIVSNGSSEKSILPKPSVVLLDLFLDFALPVIKETSLRQCPVIGWFTAPLSHGLELMGPEHLGGHGDLGAKIAAVAAQSGKTPMEVADSVYKSYEGKLVRVPGLPLMYDYELYPQEDLFPFPAAIIVQHCHKTLLSCDAMMTVTMSAFESESIEACDKWMKSLSKNSYIVGPLEDAGALDTRNDKAASITAEDKDIMIFLDSMQAQHGDRSVIYMAFGTFWYPKDPTKLYAFIDEVLASGRPFLWGHASPLAKLPEDLIAKFAAAPNAFHANWVPQRAILHHSATGWFVSHGGWNSIQEALSLQVPLILWPFGGDQATNAALLTTSHHAAFELISVRTGGGARQPYRLKDQDPVDFSVEGVRREVQALLRKLEGPEGREIRTKAEALGAAVAKSWSSGSGEAAKDLENFLRKFVD